MWYICSLAQFYLTHTCTSGPHSQTEGVKWNRSVVTSVLVTVGELAQVSEPEMTVYADDLFSIIIDMLQVCPVC